jgi:hypothetical protein
MSSEKFFRNITRQEQELEQIVAKITNLSSLPRNVRTEAAKKIQKAWKAGRRRQVRQLMRNIQAGNVNNLANEFVKLNLVTRNNSGNVIMNNAPPIQTKKRKSNAITNGKTAKASVREVNLPNRFGNTSQIMGLDCVFVGMPRYLKKAQKAFDELGYVSAFFDYNIETDQYGITKSVDTIIKRSGNVYNLSNKFNVTKQVHFFMVGIRDGDSGHAVSVLVDPRDPKNRRIWVCDPHGENSKTSIWGKIMRKKIVPVIQKMFKIPGRKIRYYGGRDLQSGDTRGVCTTFYVTFMDMIPYLLDGRMKINQIANFAKKNSTAIRAFFLNFAPETAGRMVVKNRTK